MTKKPPVVWYEDKALKKKKFLALTCKLVLTEGQFNMETYTGFAKDGYTELDQPQCGTACCLGGNMMLAARRLRLQVTDHNGYVLKDVVDIALAIWKTLHPDVHHPFNRTCLRPDEAVMALLKGEDIYCEPKSKTRKYVARARRWIRETGV